MHFDSMYSQTVQTIKNGEVALMLRKSYTNGSKYDFIFQFSKVSLRFDGLWDNLRFVLSHTCLETRFSITHCQFR